MDGEPAVGAELPEAGHALRDEEPLVLDGGVVLNDEGHFGAGADEGHVAFEDVEDLREFVEAGLAEEAAGGGDARIEGLVGSVRTGAELRKW